MGGGIVPFILNWKLASEQADEQKKTQDVQRRLLEMQIDEHRVKLAEREGATKADKERMKFIEKYMSPGAVEPSAGGAVPPGTPPNAGPQAGMSPMPLSQSGIRQDMTSPQLIDMLIQAQTMFPKPGGDITAGMAPLIQAKEKMGMQDMLQGLIKPFAGGGGPSGGAVPPQMGGAVPPQLGGGGAQNPLASIIEFAGKGDPNAIATLTAMKMSGLDPGRLPDMAKPDIALEKGLMEDGRTGVFRINKKTGEKDKEPTLISKGAEWDFSPPQVTPQGTVVYEYRKDLGLQGSFAKGLVSVHQTAPPETSFQDVISPEGAKGVVRLPKFGQAGGFFQTAPPETTLETINQPGGGTKAVRVPKYGKAGETFDTGPEKGTPPDQAGRMQLAQMGADAVKELSRLLINKDGSINRNLILKATSPIPVGEGRRVNSLLLSAIEAPIRAATGAVVNPEELKNYLRIYGVNIIDPDDLVVDKLSRLFEFNAGFARKIDPTGELLKRVGEKLDIPGKVGGAGVKYKATATNPKTGEKVGLTEDGKWVPVK